MQIQLKPKSSSVAAPVKSDILETSTHNVVDSQHDVMLEMDTVVFKRYLDYLEHFDILPASQDFENTTKNIRIRRISRIVYDREENIQTKLSSVLASMHSFESTVSLILDAKPSHTDIYFAIAKQWGGAGLKGAEAIETFETSMRGNFPGIDVSQNLFDEDIRKLLSAVQGDQFNTVASVVGVPSLKESADHGFSQGIDKLVEGMQGKEYFAIIQASPVSNENLEKVERAYQDIYTSLSTFEQIQLSVSENESHAVGRSLTEGVTTTISHSVGNTQSSAIGNTVTNSNSKSTTESKFDLKKALAGSASGAAAGAIAAGSVSGGMGAPAGAAVGALTGLAGGLFGGSETESFSESNSRSETQTNSTSKTSSNSEAKNKSTTDSDTKTTGTGKNIQITEKNRRVMSMLQTIDTQLKRIEECKSFGMWTWGAFFMSSSTAHARLGADLYSGILRGDVSGVERHNVTVWNRYKNEQRFIGVQSYLSQLKAPIMQAPEGFHTKILSPISLVSTKELSVAMSLPQKSLAGTPVMDAVAFGRSVNTRSNSMKSIHLGSIFNFGQVNTAQKVNIDVDSLSSHAFVTGSTGAGKSNTVYSILESLYTDHKIPFLVIEPAKGEYKEVFGGREGVNVFGTNPKKTPLLQLNPFAFPDDIHVIEHIDQLIEILNAVWPMYAAMPAILKESIELCYEDYGWDLLNSEYEHSSKKFPDFHDLLRILPRVIHQSDYSDEMKGNYSGALVTRVKSLTNGYFSSMFQKDELPLEKLFDESCIIDLSRVGSSETKSLLMGMLFLKLKQYRVANSQGTNSKLKHVTVLEEAHNLLRRTSSEQSAESTNLQGKAVEMIVNGIAEMRTYGQGFIIADQSPGLLDQAVIRNTNTKIIHRLPDYDDRFLVGRSAHLNDEQILELARLETGCAAIYQNNWLEPVLCLLDRFDVLSNPFIYNQKIKLFEKSKVEFQDKVKYLLTKSFETKITSPSLHKILIETIDLSTLLNRVPMTQNIEVWVDYLSDELKIMVGKKTLLTEEHNQLLQLVLTALSVEAPHNKPFFDEQIERLSRKKEGIL